MKKAQINQAFTYIFAAIVIVVILFLGFRGISNINSNIEKTELFKFKENIVSKINTQYSNFGSIKTITITLPTGVEKVCFFDLYKSINDCNANLTNEGIKNAKIMCDAWQSQTQNILLEPLQDIEINVERMEIDNIYFCTDKKEFQLELEGTGSSTKVKLK